MLVVDAYCVAQPWPELLAQMNRFLVVRRDEA